MCGPYKIHLLSTYYLMIFASFKQMPVISIGELCSLKKRYYCAHASETFNTSQQHYHTIYKEILAVKYKIEKFDFYLRGHKFKVEMDNSSTLLKLCRFLL
ncbi:hypothetical protein ACOSQ3_019481 [Xanthoceras sorbifolium]